MMVTTFGAPKHTAPPSPAQGVFVRYLLRYSAPRRAIALVIRQPSVRGRWLNSSRSGFLKLVYDRRRLAAVRRPVLLRVYIPPAFADAQFECCSNMSGPLCLGIGVSDLIGSVDSGHSRF